MPIARDTSGLLRSFQNHSFAGRAVEYNADPPQGQHMRASLTDPLIWGWAGKSKITLINHSRMLAASDPGLMQ